MFPFLSGLFRGKCNFGLLHKSGHKCLTSISMAIESVRHCKDLKSEVKIYLQNYDRSYDSFRHLSEEQFYMTIVTKSLHKSFT